MYVMCEVDGEKFDRYITGTLLEPKQRIPVTTKIEPIPDSDVLVAVYPVTDTEVKWKDGMGDIHTSRLPKGQPFAVPKKFITEL